jgi:hypothetical protein
LKFLISLIEKEWFVPMEGYSSQFKGKDIINERRTTQELEKNGLYIWKDAPLGN